MTSRSESGQELVGRRVKTRLGEGVVRNVVLQGGKVTTVLVRIDGQPDNDRHWRAIPVQEVTA